MKFANATKFYRKSGATEGSAVRPGWLPKASGSHTRSLGPEAGFSWNFRRSDEEKTVPQCLKANGF